MIGKNTRTFHSHEGLRLIILMAAPSLDVSRYRAHASRRACIRSAHLFDAPAPKNRSQFVETPGPGWTDARHRHAHRLADFLVAECSRGKV